MMRFVWIIAALIAFAVVQSVHWGAVPGCLSGGAFSGLYCQAAFGR